MTSAVTDNAARQRFELVEDGFTAFANYRRSGSNLVIPHVEAPPPLRGKGTAARLMEGVAALARATGPDDHPPLQLCPDLVPEAPRARRSVEHRPLSRQPFGPAECLTKISQAEPILAHGDPR